MKKIGFLHVNGGNYIIYHNDKERYNKYCIYFESIYQDKKHDWPTRHRNLVNKFANLYSCVCDIKDRMVVD